MHLPEFPQKKPRSDSPVFCLPDKNTNQSFTSSNLNKSKSQNEKENPNDSFGSFGKQDNVQPGQGDCSFSNNDQQNQFEKSNLFDQMQEEEALPMPNFGNIEQEESFGEEPRFGQIESETQINFDKHKKVFLQEQLVQMNQQFVKREYEFEQTLQQMKSREYLTKSCMVYFKVKFALNSIANVINNRINSYKVKLFCELKHKNQLISISQFQKAQTICFCLNNKLGKLFQVLQERNLKLKYQTFQFLKFYKVQAKQLEEFNLIKNELIESIKNKTTDYVSIKQKYEELQNLAGSLRGKEQLLTTQLIQKDNQVKKLQRHGNKIIQEQTIEEENQELKDKIQNSQTCMSNFLKQMNDLLNYHETYQQSDLLSQFINSGANQMEEEKEAKPEFNFKQFSSKN